MVAARRHGFADFGRSPPPQGRCPVALRVVSIASATGLADRRTRTVERIRQRPVRYAPSAPIRGVQAKPPDGSQRFRCRYRRRARDAMPLLFGVGRTQPPTSDVDPVI